MMSGTKKHKLIVYIGQTQKIGILNLSVGSESEITLNYTQEWINNGFALSPYLPLGKKISTVAVNNYLRNLLPEGQGFEDLVENTTISKSNTFALIRAIGKETSGALSFNTGNLAEQKTIFREIGDSELSQKLKLALNNLEPISIWDGKTRLSVAGVQDKLNLLVLKDEKMGFGEGKLCSNYIFKFETGRIPFIVTNELFTMLLAKKAGLSIPDIGIKQYGKIKALSIKRFDRKYLEDKNVVKRKHVIDSCQATNLPPSYKYERQYGDGEDTQIYRDGVSFAKLFNIKTENRSEYQRQLTQWMTFNLITKNYDAHGKNISFFVGKNGLKLTPFYDLVNIEAIIQSSRNRLPQGQKSNIDDRSNRFFAMSIGDWEDGTKGNFTSHITAYMLADFATLFGISLPRMTLIMTNTINNTLAGIQKAKSQAMEYNLNQDEIAHIDLCIEIVKQASAELISEVKDIESMSVLM